MNLNKKLLSGSLILMIYFNVYNALNFVFHIIMARLLSTSDYGILATLFSIIYALSIFSESIQTILVKYTTEESDKGKIKNILYRSLKRAFVISSIIFVLYAILSIPMSSFLKISYLLLLFNGLMVFGAFILPVTRGILQGRKKFFSLGNNLLIETGIKLLLASTFVFIGFNVFGAMIGTFIGVFTAFALSFISLREVIFSKEKKALTEGIYAYSKPTFFALTILLVFYSFDIILAKIYFNPELAGAYALASILAKTIFFGTQPISKAMFPLSAEKNNTKKQSDDIFKSALTLLLGAVSLALLLLFFFGDKIMFIFSGKIVEASLEILFLLGIVMSLLSLTNLFLLYKLSKGKSNNLWYVVLALIIQIILTFIFHSSLMQFSISLLVSSAFFLWISIYINKD